MFSRPSPGVAQAIADIDIFLAELRRQLAAARHRVAMGRGPSRCARARRRLLRQLAQPNRN